MVSFKTSNIVGSGAQKTWSQAHTIVYGENDQLMVVVAVSVDDDESLLDLVTIGSEILNEIEIKGRSRETAKDLEELYEEICADLDKDLRIELLLSRLKDFQLSLFGKGEVEAFLSRSNQLAKLGNKITGNLRPGDVIVIATSRLSQILGIPKMKRILAEENSPSELDRKSVV